jgi:hypothetical protein
MVLSGDTSGAVTLTVPAVAGTNTATLPAATGTVMVSGNQPAFSAYAGSNSAGQTSNTFVKGALNTETFDTASAFDSTTNYRFQPTVAGYYQINASVYLTAASSLNGYQITFYKNGSSYTSSYYSSTVLPGIVMPASALIYLNGSTDYLELYAYATTVAGSWVINSGAATTMSGSLVRGA